MSNDPPDYLSDDDHDLWQRVTQGIKRSLPRKKRSEIKQPLSKKAKKPAGVSPSTPTPQPPASPRNAEISGNTLDRRTEQRLRQGKMPIDETIDLHGMTQDQAQSILTRRLTQGHRIGRRTFLVITGKGLRSGAAGAVLRKALPIWCGLPPLSDIILRSVPARAHHGGSGAFYIYLRRRRDSH